MKKTLLLLTLSTFLFSSAQNLFQDNFDLYTAGIDLSGQGTWTNNSSLPGGGGTASSSGPGASKVIETGMTYLDYGTSIKSADIKINSDGCGTPFTAVTTGDVYIGLVLNLASAQANNNSDFFRVLSGGNFNTSFRMYATPSGSGFVLGIAKGANGNPISTTTIPLNFNQDHLIIFKYTQNIDVSDDIVSLYVNPVYANGVPAVASATTGAGLDQAGNVDRLIFRQNWTNGMPTGRFGLVSVALTWEELTFNPLATDDFFQSSLKIVSNEVTSGLLSIQSKINLDDATLSIYDIQGRNITSKKISINEGYNQVIINPITNSGVYILNIASANGDFTQKIIVK